VSTLHEQAQSAEDAGDFELAFSIWNELASKERDPALFCRTGAVAEKTQKWNEAESAFRKALTIDPTSAEGMESLGSLFLTRTDGDPSRDLLQAREWFQRALRITRGPRLLTFLGSTYAALKDYEAAKKALEEALRLDPTYEEAYFNLALLEKARNGEEAQRLLAKAIDLDPDYAKAHQQLGILLQKAGDPLQAEYHFRRCLEINSTDYWSRLYLANVLAVQGVFGDAEREFRAAIALQPANPVGFDLFAKFLDARSRPDEANQVRASKPAQGDV